MKKGERYQEIVSNVNVILNQYNTPLTVRQIFYRLVSLGVISNTRSCYQTISRILVKAREKDDVDENMIIDRSRQVLGDGDKYTYSDIDDFISLHIDYFKNDLFKLYNKSLWKNQQYHLVVVLEKDALSSLVYNAIEQYQLKLYVLRGYPSYSYLRKMVDELADISKPIKILYLGDYDPSGRDIQNVLKDRLLDFGLGHFELERIAITKEQIDMFNLPPKPEDEKTLEKLKRDPRAKNYGLDYACELDALEPTTLQNIIKQSVEKYIDPDKWNRIIHEIEIERTKLQKMLSNVQIIVPELESIDEI